MKTMETCEALPIVEREDGGTKRFYKVEYKWEPSMYPITEIFLSEKLSDIIDYLHRVEESELVKWKIASHEDLMETSSICEV